MVAGRPPKPVEQKKRIGNPGGRKLANTGVGGTVVDLGLAAMPEPHRPLGKAGLELWGRLWTGGASWLRPASDAEAVLLVCEAIDERQALRYRVMSDPDLWRERKALRELEKQINVCLGELGMNPVDRGRLNVGETRVNEFAELNARIAARRSAS
jgi:hypothetical protein